MRVPLKSGSFERLSSSKACLDNIANAVCVALLMVGCVGAALAEPHPIPETIPVELQGTWKQVDDGRYLELTATSADFFDYTKSLCYRSVPDSGKPLHESFELYTTDGNGSVLKLWRQDYGERFERFFREEFVRVNHLPHHTIHHPEEDTRFQDPLFIANIICQQFDEYFPFFEQRKFDWPARRQKLIDSIGEDATDQRLFDVLCATLTGLGDSHTRVYWTKRNEPFKSGQARVLTYLKRAFDSQRAFDDVREFNGNWHGKIKRSVESLLTDGPIRYAANERFRWGILKGNIGYIENEFINGFSPKGTRRPEEVEILGRELDRVLDSLKECQAIILDLSLNAGGYDPAALTIASRFADQRRHVMTIQTAQGKSRARKCFVSPVGPFQFTKPVLVLTSNATVSAGEALVMALKAFPHVRQVGEPTRGCLSGFLNKGMPHDFHLTLSADIWTLPDGTVAEGSGLQPDVAFPVFAEDDLFGSYLKALERTIGMIDGGE